MNGQNKVNFKLQSSLIIKVTVQKQQIQNSNLLQLLSKMDRKHTRQPSLTQESIQPYQLISILNKKLKSQTESIQWYKKMYQTAEYQKKITLNELKKKKDLIESLKQGWANEKQQRKDYELELEQLRAKLNKVERLSIGNNLNFNKPVSVTNQAMKQSLMCSPYSRNNISKQYINSINSSKHCNNLTDKPLSTQLSLDLKCSDVYNFFSNPTPVSRVLEEKNINYYAYEQFVPSDVKLLSGNHKYSFAHSSTTLLNISADIMNQTIEEPISEKPAEFFVEDFLVFGPDLSDLKKKRDQDRSAEILEVKPAIFYAGNHKTHNQHVYTEIAMRCFPFNAKARRQFVESYQQLREVIEFIPQNGISKDCLILNLKGQPSPIAKHNRCFKRSNLSEMQFIICLKVPDFFLVAKDERHYQRAQQQIWLVDKYYAIVSYYPFFDIHLNILTKIHSILFKEKLQKILVDKEKFYTFDIRRNVLELQKNQKVKSIVEHFKLYRAQMGEVMFYKGHYYGTMPVEGQAESYIARMTAPIFMTNFCFQQMLLLLIGIFCEKSIVFISKNEGIATLCALFLIGILTPFPYSFSVLLNVDSQKISPFVFEYPFPMISTIKKTSQNLHQIIMLYASARLQRKDIKEQSQRMILVDIDTNSIFYQGHQSFQPLICMGHPGEEFMKEYSKLNSSYSKSFSFPKKMDARKEVEQFSKRQQERNRIIEDIEQTIKSNTMKMPSFQLTQQVHKTLSKLISYVRSFTLQGRELHEALELLHSNQYHSVLRKYLMDRHPTRGQLVERIINSQYYADYLHLHAEQ